MSKRNIAIVVIAIVLVVSFSVLLVKPEPLQGKFFKVKGIPTAEDFMNYYSHKNKIVSVVTSKVISAIPSVIASPVASAVTVQKDIASRIDISKLKELTENMLKSIAKEEYKKNPSRFTLSNKEKAKIIELYKQKNRLR